MNFLIIVMLYFLIGFIWYKKTENKLIKEIIPTLGSFLTVEGYVEWVVTFRNGVFPDVFYVAIGFLTFILMIYAYRIIRMVER